MASNTTLPTVDDAHLPPVPDTTAAAQHIPAEADIVFCGGGTTACIIAGRLAAADPSLKIVLLEAGPPTLNDSKHTQPARFSHHLHPGSETVRFVAAQPSEHLDGRATIVPTGMCVGGGSSVNFAMYTRAAASDYDDWENIHGNKGWGSKDLIPLLQKAETYQVAPNAKNHGYDGPLKISYGGIVSDLGLEFLDVGKQMDPARAPLEDSNNFDDVNGYARWQKYIDSKTGKRSDIAHHYVYNQQHNKNLILASGVYANRVLFEGNKAVGVEYSYNPSLHGEEKANGTRTVNATKLVVSSSGAFGSPALLERSGIGRKDVLEKFDIKELVELKGVGENYHDHTLILPVYRAADDAVTMDPITRLDPTAMEEESAVMAKTGGGLMSSNFVDSGLKARLTPEDVESMGPVFKKRWESFFEPSPDKPVVLIAMLASFLGDFTKVAPAKYFSHGLFAMHPMSIGSTHISSATDPFANPIFIDNFVSCEEDVQVLLWAYKHSRELARRMPSYRGEVAHLHPNFPKGSEAAANEDSQPVPINAPKIRYTSEDDEAIKKYIRDTVGTTWHSLGTCAMKRREENGVVDPNLNVYGTSNLKVADMSIAPSNVAANTYNTAIAIGERASIIIANELGIQL